MKFFQTLTKAGQAIVLAGMLMTSGFAQNHSVDCFESANRAFELVLTSRDGVSCTDNGVMGIELSQTEAQTFLTAISPRIAEVEQIVSECPQKAHLTSLNHLYLMRSLVERDWAAASREAGKLLDLMPHSSALIFDVISSKMACEVLLGQVLPEELNYHLEASLHEVLNKWGSFGDVGATSYYSSEFQAAGILTSLSKVVDDPNTKREFLVAAATHVTSFCQGNAILKRRLFDGVSAETRAWLDRNVVIQILDIYSGLLCSPTDVELSEDDVEVLSQMNDVIDGIFRGNPNAARQLMLGVLYRVVTEPHCTKKLRQTTVSRNYLDDVLGWIATDPKFFSHANIAISRAEEAHGMPPIDIVDTFHSLVRDLSIRLDAQGILEREDFQSFVLRLTRLALDGDEKPIAVEYLEILDQVILTDSLRHEAEILRARSLN